jgi:hypothetical protein
MIVDEQRRNAILADCVERLRAGETEADCLARYGDEAAAIAPLLRAAARLHRVSAYTLSPDQHNQAKAVLRAAMLEQGRGSVHSDEPRPRFIRLALAGPLRGLATAATLVLILCVIVTITAVAASRPGDAAYSLRVIVERAPVLLQTTTVGKTMAELRISERRLADLEAHLAASGEIAAAAVKALLAGDQAAAGRADDLSQMGRAQVAAHVAAHAEALARLAQSAQGPSDRTTLQAASAQVEALAQDLLRDAPPPGSEASVTPPAGAPALSDTHMPPATATATSTARGSQSPSATATPVTLEPTRIRETPTAGAVGPGQRATALAQTATASPEKSPTSVPASPTSTLGTPSAGPSGTPAPGRRATALAQTATATHTAEPTPTPTATKGPDTPMPGRRATALAQTATATVTPVSATPVPGRRATALAQTATPGTSGNPVESGSWSASTPRAR